jgi:hypothetical protein
MDILKIRWNERQFLSVIEFIIFQAKQRLLCRYSWLIEQHIQTRIYRKIRGNKVGNSMENFWWGELDTWSWQLIRSWPAWIRCWWSANNFEIENLRSWADIILGIDEKWISI